MKTNELKIERKPLINGLASILSKETGNNIYCNEYISKKYRSYDDGKWIYDTRTTYELKEDDTKIFSLTDVTSRILGQDGITLRKYNDIDKYISYDLAKALFTCVSLKYDIDMMYLFDELVECKKVRNKYIETKYLKTVFDNYSTAKKIIK